MRLNYIFSIFFLAGINFSALSQNYAITWQSTIGGTNSDKLSKMIQTSDGGMLLCGYSNSNISGAKKQNAINNTYDFWLVKLTAAGGMQWSKTIGGSDRDLNPTVIHTSDNGYLVAGSSISPHSGSKTEDAINKSFDYWALKLDASGNILWDNTIGGIQFEKIAVVLEAPNGYFLCGSSNSTYGDDKTALNEGSSLWADYWVVKLNQSGAVVWDSTYGSKNRDVLTAAVATPDGGILLGGSSYSPRYADKIQDYVGNNDYWIVKLDGFGRKQIDRTIGGDLSDYLTSIDVVGNTGYILGGYSNSPASYNKSQGRRGVTDYWLVRINQQGALLWNKTYGGNREDYLTSVKSYNGKFLVGGYSNSPVSGDKTIASKGGMDFWTLILDKNGDLLEQNVWGGAKDDFLVDFVNSGTNSYTLAGTSLSPKSGDKTVNTIGNTKKSDYSVFKIAPAGTIAQSESIQPVIANKKVKIIKSQLSLEISPNPVRDVVNYSYSISNAQQITLSIYSNNSKLVKQEALSQANGNAAFDFSAQPSGVYYAVLQSGNSSITKKFVKN